MRWEKLFEPHILERGYAYYREGSVTDISIKEKQIDAIVKGSEDYSVTIDLKNGQVEDMECTCPYAEDGKHCKHMAAVLYAYENVGKDKQSQKLTYEQLKDAVDNAESVVLRRFLTDVLWSNEKYRLQFLSMLHPEREEDMLAAAKARLNEIVDDAEGYDGYIDYYAASRFIADISEWMDEEIDPLLERRQDRSAFKLSIHVIESLDGVEMDDSDGGITEIASRCYDIWKTILDRSDEKLEEEIFEFFLNNIDGQVVDYLEDYYEDILMARFDKPEYLKKKLALYQMHLATVNPNATDWTSKHHAEHCIRQIQSLMIQMGKPQEELEAFNKKYWSYPFIRKAYMEECKEKKDWTALINVLLESITLDEKNDPSLARGYHILLKDAYLQAGQTENYQKELTLIATQLMPGDIDSFREYKQLFSEDQWPEKREEIFSIVRDKFILNRLYSEEKLLDRLLENVLSSPGLFTLLKYEAELLPAYPQQILDKYVREINAEARNAANRDIYQAWVKTLHHMRSLPGGNEAVRQIVNEWRDVYRRRKAMMEELNKL